MPGTIHALRLVRQDSLAGREEYVLFDRGVVLGSDPGCAVPLPHASVAPAHAHLLWLAGSFWVEPAGPERSVVIDGKALPAGRVAPLAPGQTLQLGEVRLFVTAFRQYGLDPVPAA